MKPKDAQHFPTTVKKRNEGQKSDFGSCIFQVRFNRRKMYCRNGTKSRQFEDFADEVRERSTANGGASLVNANNSIGDILVERKRESISPKWKFRLKSPKSPINKMSELHQNASNSSPTGLFTQSGEQFGGDAEFGKRVLFAIYDYLSSLLQRQENLMSTLIGKNEELNERNDQLHNAPSKNRSFHLGKREKRNRKDHLDKYERLVTEIQSQFGRYSRANEKLLQDWCDYRKIVRTQSEELSLKQRRIFELEGTVRSLEAELQTKGLILAEACGDLIKTNDVLMRQKDATEILSGQLEQTKVVVEENQQEMIARLLEKEEKIDAISAELSEANAKSRFIYDELVKATGHLKARKFGQEDVTIQIETVIETLKLKIAADEKETGELLGELR